jgi:heme exporter protein C
MALQAAIDDPRRAERAGAVLAIVGVVNVPIIYYSVEWWNTLHQPASVVKLGGPAIHSSILAPLLVMAVAYTAFYIWVVLLRMRREITEGRIRAFRMRQAGI